MPTKVELVPGLLCADELDVGLVVVIEGNLLGPEIQVVLLLGYLVLKLYYHLKLLFTYLMLPEVMVREALEDDFENSSFN